jgi:hypothetical protein
MKTNVVIRIMNEIRNVNVGTGEDENLDGMLVTITGIIISILLFILM